MTSDENPFFGRVRQLWRACTTTPDGSLSETFKLVVPDTADDDNDGGSTSTQIRAKIIVADDSFLDAVVVDTMNTNSTPRGGSDSTGFRPRTPEFSALADDPGYYDGGFKSWLQHRVWPRVVAFFDVKFPEHEEDYQAQAWHARKGLAFWASLFLVLNWGLYLFLNNESTKLSLNRKLIFWGGYSLFTLATPFMVALDMPRRSEVFFQVWFCIAVWYCGIAEVIQMRECIHFTQHYCFDKNSLATSYYITGLPALMMFIVSKRLYNFIAQIICFVLLVVLILPIQGLYTRNVASFVVFSIFMQGLQYTSENDRRKLFYLALQLKQAFEAKHRAQTSEAKGAFTKRRFANYIFHEVRVPLNTALLAFQLIQSGNALKEEFVLNDVLDFEKMDSGHFETIARPFPLHHAVRAILNQVQVHAKTRQLVLISSLDERIDAVPVPGAEESGGLWVLGSELRLQQILTNLASNAVKFTPEGGVLRISTEFMGISDQDELPGTPPDIDFDDTASSDDDDGEDCPPTSGRTGTKTRCLNLRLIVHDSGPGIKRSDLVEDKLFQPFSQTTLGRTSESGEPLFTLSFALTLSSTPGTGLGLAIVKGIVRHGGGRLGVTSQRGEGSKFWVELSYPIASAVEIAAARDVNDFTVPAPLRHGEPDKDAGFNYAPLIAVIPVVVETVLASLTIEPNFEPSIPPSYESSLTLPPPPSALDSPNPLTNPLLILVVDDDALTRLLSSKLLEKLGCVVHTAKNGQECVNMVLAVEPHTYDLICLDNFMPVLTGEAAIKEIRAHARDDFVVGCTGNALTEDQISYRQAGVDAVLVKPVMIQCVVDASNQLVVDV
ncbi:hypothetical protein C8R46DRAFT_1285747 [Mycena filopes]|nr:hypothetical protein C8R46DRAFT_1285747 [Mycena filopes]